MLSQLSINQVAVIEKASLNFEEGMTVLTGETGAGKSIIIDAINAVLGERTSKDLIRTGAVSARVSALFSEVGKNVADCIYNLGFPVEEDGTLLIQREIRSAGKSLCKINGMAANVSMLKQLGMLLISIHGQHESYELLSETAHIEYIDSFGELEVLLKKYQECYKHLKTVQKQLGEFEIDEAEKSRKIDLLTYQIGEIEDAGISLGEQDTLTKERDRIRNSEEIVSAIGVARRVLSGDEEYAGVLSELASISTGIERVLEYLPSLPAIVEKLQEASYLLEDANAVLRNVDIDYDPSRLEEIETRLDVIYRLSLKYGQTEAKILDFLEISNRELNSVKMADKIKEALVDEYEELKKQAISLAKEISQRRKTCAKAFENQVKEELGSLNMLGIAFVVDITRVPLYNLGCDKVQFLISANKGEAPKAMSKIASGGELSRIMLAIKAVLSNHDTIDTLIFDEVDTGISGEAAKKVGERLKKVSTNRQTICITHLPQIAAMADHQVLISKHTDGHKTFTQVQTLEEDERIREIARMVSGDNPGEVELDMAKTLLKKSLTNAMLSDII